MCTVSDCKLTMLGCKRVREHYENLSLMLNNIEIKLIKHRIPRKGRKHSKTHHYASVHSFLFSPSHFEYTVWFTSFWIETRRVIGGNE